MCAKNLIATDLLAIGVLIAANAPGAFAQTTALTPAEGNVTARLVDAQCFPLSTDHSDCAWVLLLQSETLDGMVDLIIAPQESGEGPIVARDIAAHGPLDEQRARLTAEHNRTFSINSQQAAHGRYPWFEILTVTNREGTFQVVGYHYSTYDRAMGGDFSCSVDLLSGRWEASASRVEPETGNITQSWDVAERGYPDETDVVWWSYREPPAQCDDVMEDWFDAAP